MCEYEGEVEFLQVTGYARMLSGIIDVYDKQYLQQITEKVKKFGGTIKRTPMQGMRFDNIIKHHQKHIDYLSIGIEGGEMSVLRSIDFKVYDITLISIENKYKNKDITNFLQNYGYKKIISLGYDEFYARDNV